MIYSDFCAPTLSTSADTAATTATIKYNGVGGHVIGFWGTSGAQTATAAQGIKPYALITGNGMPGVVPTFPIGRWRSAYLAGASVGSVSSDPSFLPLDAPAPAGQSITVDVRNAASSAAPKSLVGVLYGTDTLDRQWAAFSDPWNLRGVPKTYMMAGPASITAAAEGSVGTITIPTQFPHVVGLSTYGVTNGVRVTAEEFIGTARYTATGVQGGQFEPSQNWPFFGQQDAPVGTDIQDESFMPAHLWHPIDATCASSSTIQSLVTLQTAISNATSFQFFAALM